MTTDSQLSKKVSVWVLVISISFLLGSCKSNPGDSSNSKSNTEIYFHDMKTLVVDVFYEPGAEPYVGTTAGGRNYWSFLEDNLKALFDGRSVTINVYKTLETMNALSAQNKSSWSALQIVDLGNANQKSSANSSEIHFSIFFLNGYAVGSDGQVNQNTIGFSVTGTRFIAMFKDVIRSTGSTQVAIVPKYVEQSTLIHEMGHALGLVNNGLTLTSSHHDSTHGAHCSNTNCVMYYLNEGKSDAQSFAQQLISSGSTIMFDSACLNDAKSF